MELEDYKHGLAELARARHADDMIWSSPYGSTRFRSERNHAVLAAHRAGVSVEQIADELGVLLKDVASMMSAAEGSAGSGHQARAVADGGIEVRTSAHLG